MDDIRGCEIKLLEIQNALRMDGIPPENMAALQAMEQDLKRDIRRRYVKEALKNRDGNIIPFPVRAASL